MPTTIIVNDVYKWTCNCGKEHELPAYAVAHWSTCLEFTCSCTRTYSLIRGILTLIKGEA